MQDTNKTDREQAAREEEKRISSQLADIKSIIMVARSNGEHHFSTFSFRKEVQRADR